MIDDYDRIRDKIEAVFPTSRISMRGSASPAASGCRCPRPSGSGARHPGKPSSSPSTGLTKDPTIGDSAVLRLTTIRSHDQYNTTIYGLDDRYRGVFGRRDVVFIHTDDLAALNIQHGDAIDIETALPSGTPLRLEGFTAIAHNIARGSAAAYYPEANGLVPLAYHDPQSGTPSYKSVPVRIMRHA